MASFHHNVPNSNSNSNHSHQLCFEHFLLIHKCGEGNGGVVWKALRKTDSFVCAIKILREPLCTFSDERGKPKEAFILEILNEHEHPHIVKYYGWGKVDAYELEQLNIKCFVGEIGTFIVMEWVEGSTLQDKISDSLFGKSKRIQAFKQLLSALIYIHSKRITHGEVYLDNIIISMPDKRVSQYRLVLCDYGASSILLEDSNIHMVDSKLGQDHFQCGGILFSLFSSANINMQIVSNKIMQKDAFEIAKDLIDARRAVTLEAIMGTPFLNGISEESLFTHYFNSTPWNAEIVENIAGHLIRAGEAKDFISASLSCKQFYLSLQKQFLCVPQSQDLNVSIEYDLSSLSSRDFQASVADMSLHVYHVACSPFSLPLDVTNYQDFELQVINKFTTKMQDEITRVESLLLTMTMENCQRQWQLIFFRFHDMRGSCNCIGNRPISCLAWYGRNRARAYISGHRSFSPQELLDETKLYFRIVFLMKSLLKNYNSISSVKFQV